VGATERISVNDALKSLTLWGAYQHFEEQAKGSIETGKVADFVVLSADPFAVDIEALSQLTVMETIKGGKSIYTADAQGRKVGGREGQALPELAGLTWQGNEGGGGSEPPRQGIYAYGAAAGPCGCAGCVLSHIITMGSRDVR
jgi:hypothetical protein